MAKMTQEEAHEQARKCKQWGMVVPLAMSVSKHDKFSIITIDNEDDEEKTPPPFILQFRWDKNNYKLMRLLT